MIERNQVYLGDCMEGMAQMPDDYIDLAIVDPPYGIGIVSAINRSTGPGTNSMFKMSKGGDGYDFDHCIPTELYFSELSRISKNRIIWGGNYFLDYLGGTSCMIVWDKMNGTNPMADAELAWCSFDSRVRIFRMHHFSRGYDEKIHPTQKPVKLYKWLLHNYAKPGDLILDTHVGSGSSIIACIDKGFDYIGYEIDADYYKAMQERIYHFTRQTPLL